MASLVVDHLHNDLRNRGSGVAQIYCDYKRQSEQSKINLFGCLARQFLQQQAMIPNDVLAIYRDKLEKGICASLTDILTILRSAVKDFPRAFIIVDALDELQKTSRVRQDLLSNILEIQAAFPINLMVTSRHIESLVSELKNAMYLEIRASPEDIRMYAYGHMNDLPKFINNDSALQDTIVNSVVGAVDGMFVLSRSSHFYLLTFIQVPLGTITYGLFHRPVQSSRC